MYFSFELKAFVRITA